MVAAKNGLSVLKVHSSNTFDSDSSFAHTSSVCAHCGATTMAVVATLRAQTQNRVDWMRCLNCGRPSHHHEGKTYPASKPLRAVKGVPADEAVVWDEVRVCLQAGANTGAVMLCRKLLFHVAVSHGLPAKKSNDRAPNFYECVEHLQSEGLVTPKMRPWVDRVKDVGNEMNHELDPIDPQAALDVATFTQQLLILAYEMDALQAASAPQE